MCRAQKEEWGPAEGSEDRRAEQGRARARQTTREGSEEDEPQLMLGKQRARSPAGEIRARIGGAGQERERQQTKKHWPRTAGKRDGIKARFVQFCPILSKSVKIAAALSRVLSASILCTCVAMLAGNALGVWRRAQRQPRARQRTLGTCSDSFVQFSVHSFIARSRPEALATARVQIDAGALFFFSQALKLQIASCPPNRDAFNIPGISTAPGTKPVSARPNVGLPHVAC
jgi:hypothetical protein